MSICCAFSFSLIIFVFVLFSLGWGGGSVCWCSDFFEGFYQRSWVSPLPAVPLCPWPPWFCAYPLLATDPSAHFQLLTLINPVCIALVMNVHRDSGCFAFFPQIDTALPAQFKLGCSHPCTQDTRSEPIGSVCLGFFFSFFLFRGRKRRGILHHFLKDY